MVYVSSGTLIHISPISRRKKILCRSSKEFGILKINQTPNGNYEPDPSVSHETEIQNQVVSSRICFFLNTHNSSIFRKIWYEDSAYLLSPNDRLESVDIWVNMEIVSVKENNNLNIAFKSLGVDYCYEKIYYSESSVKVRLLSDFEKRKLYEG